MVHGSYTPEHNKVPPVMKSEDYWMDQLALARIDAAGLRTEIDQAMGILYGGLDRNHDDGDTLRTLCVVAVNALKREREELKRRASQ